MKKIWKWVVGILITLVIIAVTVDLVIGYLVFNFAFGRTGLSSFYSEYTGSNNTTYYPQNGAQLWHETASDGTKLVAYYLPAKKPTKKTVVVVHGFGSNAEQMTAFVKIFRDDGYNVLAPDSRAFAQSGGQYIGYGIKDVPDLVGWTHQINQRIPNGEIGLFGTSMGASEIMFALPKMPSNVKFAIADSGYASITNELGGQIESVFHVPSWLFVPATDVFVMLIARYNLYDGNTKTTLAHNRIPLFIIQGKNDRFVPVKNAKINYQNDYGKKKLWLVKDSDHVSERANFPQLYDQKVSAFAAKYFR